MPEVQWIKLYIDMFDKRKINKIRRLPAGNDILLFWVMLLATAGKCNTGGMIFITERVPFTKEDLADEFDFEISTIELALKAFVELDMIDLFDDGFISVRNWEEYQNTDRLAEIREYNRLAQQKSRAKKKLLQDVNDKSMTSQSCQALDKKREEKKKEKKKEVEVVVMGANAPDNDDNQLQTFGKVKLTENQVADLLERMGLEMFDEYCDRLSDFIDKTGATVKSHYSTILKWYNEDRMVKA